MAPKARDADRIGDALRAIDPVRDRGGQPIYDESGEQVTRATCATGERPCPRVTCRQNLLPDQMERGGSPGPFTCAMDVVDAHPQGITRNAAGVLMVRHQNEIRDIEERALAKFTVVAPGGAGQIVRVARAKQRASVSFSLKLPPPIAAMVLDDAAAAGKPAAVYIREVLVELYGAGRRRS